MKLNFTGVPDSDDYSPLPDNDYLIEIASVEERQVSSGDQWNLKLAIQEPEYPNRHVFDSLTFSEAGMKRVKLILSRLGFDVSGELEIEPSDLVGIQAYVTLETESYFSEKHGKEMKKNKVTYAGWQSADAAAREVIQAPAKKTPPPPAKPGASRGAPPASGPGRKPAAPPPAPPNTGQGTSEKKLRF